MRQISLNDKLVVYFVILGVAGVIIVQSFSYYQSRNALLSRTFDQLISVRVHKKKQIETFFANRLHEASLIAASAQTAAIIRKLNNPDKADLKQLRDSFDPFMLNYLSGTGFYKRLVFVEDSGRSLVVYTTTGRKDSLFIATDLLKNIPGLAFATGSDRPVVHDLVINPGGQQASLYVSAPANVGKHHVRILLEMALSPINRIMLENTPKNGLGKSGETYLVGADLLMRSQSRFEPHSVLNTAVNTVGSQRALKGQTGISTIEDYRDINVLSSYSPLDIPGLHWAILAEIDTAEAMAPVFRLLKNVLLITLTIAVLIFIFAYMLSRRITSPLIRLNKAAQEIGKGALDVNLPIISNDEIGELTESFNRMAGQLKKNREALVREREKQLQSMIDGQEQERQRLSRDLHDGLGQSFIAIRLQLENFCNGIDAEKKENLETIKDHFDAALEDIRRMSNDLSPSVLEEFGLVTALRNLCRSFGEQSGTLIRFRTIGPSPQISRKARIYLYRISQEALSNAMKHAKATNIELTLHFTPEGVHLEISDDGQGFYPDNNHRCKGNGLNNIKERAGLLGGQLSIDSEPGKGTQINFMYKI